MIGAQGDLRASAPQSRADFHQANGLLMVVREPPQPPAAVAGQPASVPGNPAEGVEILLAVWDDGSVSALNGHVDLGTGIRTALAQIVADELDVSMDMVHMMLGDTTRAPNQGPTIASASIQIHSVPLRQAAAQARQYLLGLASSRLGLPAAELSVENGQILHATKIRSSYAELVAGAHQELVLDTGVRVKDISEHRLIGRDMPRVDIPAKLSGELVYVHDLRLPGMLHARVVRPPYAGADHGDFIGRSLKSVDKNSIAHIPGVVAVVVIGDFVGVVAKREEHAEQAMRELVLQWHDWPPLPDLSNLQVAIRNNPSSQRVVAEQGDVEAALQGAAQVLERNYVWPYQMHASIGPSCAVAQWHGQERLSVWCGSQNPHVLRADLARLTGLDETAIDLVRMEASGCYGRNCADDVAADAVLLAQAVDAPVRVQLTRAQEHQWEPKGAAQLMEVRGGLNSDGSVAAYDFATSYPSNGAVPLAMLLTRRESPQPVSYQMGDRTSVPPYDFANLRVSINDMAPILRASWLRGVSALPNSFAHESYIDELASAAGVDPVEYRLRYLKDERAIELVKATAKRAGWISHTQAQQQEPDGEFLRGQGFAYARYVHSRFPGFGAAWAAWVADVEVNRNTGEVHVRRVVVGQDSGQMINPAGVRHQLHGNVVQTTSRALLEKVAIEPRTNTVQSKEWGSYPILNFRQVPVIDVMLMERQTEPPQGVGESASVPGTAAIANAIYDAIGVRLREPPFTPEVVRAAMQPAPALPGKPPRNRRKWWLLPGALLGAAGGFLAAMLGVKSAIAPVAVGAEPVYATELIERGRLLAAAGDCVVCHTAAGGAPNAGGLALDTPFGKVISTNITPDPTTGIGQWSFSAFQRAMREGISRDGRHLYPAFPYTAFTQTTDADLMALYAYLMSQEPVVNQPAATELAFPFGVRPLLAFWNALYLNPGPQAPDPDQSTLWNRGAYLVNGLGHCAACHSPRNALGAEKGGADFLAGAKIDGWYAPPLVNLASASVPWSEADLFDYLRTGYSKNHGAAAGPMAAVAAEMGQLPSDDLRAMAHYLASFREEAAPDAAQLAKTADAAQTRAAAAVLDASAAGRSFQMACASCHHDGSGPVLSGLNIALANNSNLHGKYPDNLAQVILHGMAEPVAGSMGYMPAFKDSMSDGQIADIINYLRARYAPAAPAWEGVEASVAKIRKMPGHG